MVGGFSRRGGPGRVLALASCLVLAACTFVVVTAAPLPASAAPFGTVANFGMSLQLPGAITTGPDGNLWFSNGASIGRITPAGSISFFPVGGAARAGVLVAGPDGNLWFPSSFGGGAIGRITTAGVVTMFEDPAIEQPFGITAGPDGNLWFADGGAMTIGRITTAGVVTTFPAGNDHRPSDIVAGPDGNLWFTVGFNGLVGRMTTAGALTYFSNGGFPARIAAGPDGNLWVTNYNGDSVSRITTAGTVTTFTGAGVDQPLGITAGPDGNVWFTNDGPGTIGRVTPAGTVTIVRDTDTARPTAITTGPDGNLWFTSGNDRVIGRLTVAGAQTNFTDERHVADPLAIGTGPTGDLWFVNNEDDTIGRFTPPDVFQTYPAGVDGSGGIVAGPDGNMWYTTFENGSIARITPDGVVTEFTSAAITGAPYGITVGPDGNLWFAQVGTPGIGRITTAGVITVFTVGVADGSYGIAAGLDGNLWFTTAYGTSSIGKITTSGVVTTFTDPALDDPQGIAAGPDGNLWFANGASIGRITPSGTITTFTGPEIEGADAITAGPDGALWFTNGDESIGRIATDGTLSSFTDPSIAGPISITATADKLWFANELNSTIGSIDALDLPGAPTGVTVVSTQTEITVSWDPPSDDGGGPIVNYDVIGTPWGAGCSTTGATSCVVQQLTADTTYTFEVIAANASGNGPPSAPSAPIALQAGSGYHPVSPARILDSRLPNVGFAGKVTAAAPRSLQVTGRGGPSNVPASAKAVVMNVTVVESSAESFLSVYPTGSPRPNASNLNFGAGQIIPNLVTVKVGAGGKVDIADAVGATHVVADVVGYYDDGTGPGDLFNPTTPRRLWDSRALGGPLRSGTPFDLQVRGPNVIGVPETATAVVANITVTGATDQTFVSVYPSLEPQPNVSNLNSQRGQTIANLAVVKIGANGSIRFANAVGDIEVIVDVVGWFDPTSGSRFHAIAPNRILDTRVSNGLSGRQAQGQSRALVVAGRALTDVPYGASGLVANVTVADATKESFVAVFPGEVDRPNPYSTVNFGINQVIPNLTMVGIAPDRTVKLYNHLGQTHLIADAVGWFAAT